MLSEAGKGSFFIGYNAGIIGTYFEAEGDSVLVYANATIVEKILGDLFFWVVEGEKGL